MSKKIVSIAQTVCMIIMICFLMYALYLRFILNEPPAILGYSVADVPTESMYPTIKPGSIIIVKAIDQTNKEIEHGDIVVFHFEEGFYCKRVIGCPNDAIYINQGVHVNGELYEEDYLSPGVTTNSLRLVFNVPDDSYFLMGDNRNNSSDSRVWANPYISYDKIVGTVKYIFYIPIISPLISELANS